mmetsp:Transcript_3113/g.6587  ORF Transcript_3113/g.6587 Transcript_3113/m.6587 type:complete len:1141 (-) Transcript_3113:11508-14930(-)
MFVLKQALSVDVDLYSCTVKGSTKIHLCDRVDFKHVTGSKADTALAAVDKVAIGANGEVNETPVPQGTAGVKPSTWDKRLIGLHCRQSDIEKITVNGVPAEYLSRDYLKQIVHDNVRDLTVFYAQLTGDLLAAKDGELEISVPESEQEKRELVVAIDFKLKNPRGGLKFAGCGEMIKDKDAWIRDGYSFVQGSNSRRYYSHMYTYNSICGADSVGTMSGASSWFPCVDTIQSRCEFYLEITIPRDLVAVGIGNRVGETFLEGTNKKKVCFHHPAPVAPHNVAISVGPYLKNVSSSMDWVRVYSLPSEDEDVVEKAAVHVRRSIKEILGYLRLENFPFSTYTQVIIDQEFSYADIVPFSTLSFVSNANVKKENEPAPDNQGGSGLMYDQHRHLHYIQAQGVAYNFFGCLVPAKSESDLWLIAGLSGYLAYRYALKTWKQIDPKEVLPDTSGNNQQTVVAAVAQQQQKLASGAGKQDENHEATQIKFFVGSTDPRELLTASFDRMQKAKFRHDAVEKQHGSAGDVVQRPLQRPSEVKIPVDSALWAARGLELDSLFSQRAFFLMHMLQRTVNAAPDDEELEDDDIFSNILHLYATQGVDHNQNHAKSLQDFFGVKPEVSGEENPNPAASGPKVPLKRSQSVCTEDGENDIGDLIQKKISDDADIIGISEFDFITELCKIGGLKSQDFRLTSKTPNFSDNWMRSCSFLQLRGGVEYRNNDAEIAVEQIFPSGQRPMTAALRIRVVEEDDSWFYDKSLTRARNEYTINLHTQRQKLRGGRKTQKENERKERWEEPSKLFTPDLLEIMNLQDEDKVWINEYPLKYVIIDPEFVWPRTITWRQSEVMYLELLNDPAMANDTLTLCEALKSLAIPRAMTEDLTVKGSTRYNAENGGPVVGGNANDINSDLRCASIIAGCIIDFARPARVRAEAIVRLAEWQRLHAPPSASDEHYTKMELEKRQGSHPWVGLNILRLALKKMFFHPETGKLLPNDFGVPGEFAMKRATTRALKIIRAKSGKPPNDVLDLILTLLRDNDNTVNHYSDAEYVKDMVIAGAEIVAAYVVGTHDEEFRTTQQVESLGSSRTVRDILGSYYEIVEHIYRYLNYDAIEPSRDHIVTAGCLEALSLLEATGVIPAKTPFFCICCI